MAEVTSYDHISTPCQLGFASFFIESAATVVIMGTNLTDEHSQFWRKFSLNFGEIFPTMDLQMSGRPAPVLQYLLKKIAYINIF